MSLARNPNMPYVAAGRQESPFERMSVRSNVNVPSADACADCDGRPSYRAPGETARAPFSISFKTVFIVVAAAAFILFMLYVSEIARQASLSKEKQRIFNEMQSTAQEMIVLQEKLAKAQEPNALRYRAAQLGMVNYEGVEVHEIYAPDTRPATADNSLSAGMARASME